MEFLGKDVRKIIKVGDSAAITLPKDYMEIHGLKIGDKMELNYNKTFRADPIDEDEIKEKIGKAPKKSSSDKIDKPAPTSRAELAREPRTREQNNENPTHRDPYLPELPTC